MDYTERQKVEWRQAYASRRRRQLAILVYLFLTMAALALGEDPEAGTILGFPAAVAGPILIALMVAGGVLAVRNWCCPACNEHLGKSLNPKHCKHCGVELRS